MIKPMQWMYGITSVPSRRDNLFPKTLASLKRSGFNSPRLFIDGENDVSKWAEFGLPVTAHYPNLKTYGNWCLALGELYIRDPNANRYALFQDDFVTGLNLRAYLEAVPFPDKGYLNLYTFPSQQLHAPENGNKTGFYLSSQNGRGAVALVFNREGVQTILSHPYMIERPRDVHRGHKSIDGGIITAMRLSGWKEYVHNPSLVQHTGDISSMGNTPHKKAVSFRGEDFDYLDLLK